MEKICFADNCTRILDTKSRRVHVSRPHVSYRGHPRLQPYSVCKVTVCCVLWKASVERRHLVVFDVDLEKSAIDKAGGLSQFTIKAPVSFVRCWLVLFQMVPRWKKGRSNSVKLCFVNTPVAREEARGGQHLKRASTVSSADEKRDGKQRLPSATLRSTCVLRSMAD
ncbi:hypothetical protein BaRGS_00008407 [Batillaria attramentaria]|uniref:Uncharacterized protein n=1 Tax=Batillaria attramentaria TaxID=370345 RepID=A0ABD0LM31_9CAEN